MKKFTHYKIAIVAVLGAIIMFGCEKKETLKEENEISKKEVITQSWIGYYGTIHTHLSNITALWVNFSDNGKISVYSGYTGLDTTQSVKGAGTYQLTSKSMNLKFKLNNSDKEINATLDVDSSFSTGSWKTDTTTTRTFIQLNKYDKNAPRATQ